MVNPPLFEIRDGVDEQGKSIKECRFSRDMEAELPMDKLIGLLESGRITPKKALSQARALLKSDPTNLELNNFVAGLLWETNAREEAADVWGKAYEEASAGLPSTPKLRISWYATDNRPFLRCGHGHVLGLSYRAQTADALALAKKLLQWCPSDNIGVRFLVPDFEYDLGNLDAALTGFLERSEERPVFWYAAGNIAFQREQFVQACTYMRRGIAGNPYVAEGLTGRTEWRDHLFWHSSNVHGCEFAVDFLSSAAASMDSEAVDFVDWVFNCSDVLRERADLMACQEALTNKHQPSERIGYIEKMDLLLSSIDDRLSTKLVCKVKNRWGDEIWPWDRLGHAYPARARAGL